jgi:hypothetical protein
MLSFLIGMMCGNKFFIKYFYILSKEWPLKIFCLSIAVVIFLMSSFTEILSMIIAMYTLGAFISLINNYTLNKFQLIVSENMKGRFFGAIYSIVQLMAPLSLFITSKLFKYFNYEVTLMIFSGFVLLCYSLIYIDFYGIFSYLKIKILGGTYE